MRSSVMCNAGGGTRVKLTCISLIVPAYNEEKYLGACLDAAIRHGSFCEILVVDNASADGTCAVAQSRPGVTLLHERRKGVTRARQRGFLEARGDISCPG